jgi:hypothetical protein
MFRQKRIPHGRPMPDCDANATDVLALLSGVNFGSVVKVLAAIEAIKTHLKIPVEDIVRFANIPTESVAFDGKHADRIEATDRLVHDLVNDGNTDYLEYALRHRYRHGAQKKVES